MTSGSPWPTFSMFCVLALGLLGLVPLLSFAFGTSMDFGALAARASSATGVPWTSNLFDVLRLCLAEPGLWLLLLGSFIPTLAALILLAYGRDAAQWRRFLRRLSPVGESRSSKLEQIAIYTALCLCMIGGLLAVFLLREATTPGEYAQMTLASVPDLLVALFFAALLDQGAVLEEGGWRGYAMPLLQDEGVVPLAAAIAVGVAWSFWHIPRDVIIGLPGSLGIATYLLLYLPAFTLGTVTTSIIAAYFVNRLGGSLIPAIVVHGIGNDAMGISGFAPIEQALTPLHQMTKAAPFALICVLLVSSSGSRLGMARREG